MDGNILIKAMIEIERYQKNDRNNTNRTFILIHTLKVSINEDLINLPKVSKPMNERKFS